MGSLCFNFLISHLLYLFLFYRHLAAKHSSDEESGSQSSDGDSLHIVRVVNIPWTATKSRLVDLFKDIKILHGAHGVHFIVDDELKYNDAFIQLATSADYKTAMDCRGVRMDYSTVNS